MKKTMLIMFCGLASALAAQTMDWGTGRPGMKVVTNETDAVALAAVTSLSNTVATLPAPTGVPIWYDASNSNYFATCVGGTGVVWKVTLAATGYQVVMSQNFDFSGIRPPFYTNSYTFATTNNWISAWSGGGYSASITYNGAGVGWGTHETTFPMTLISAQSAAHGTAVVSVVYGPATTTNYYTRLATTNDLALYPTLDAYVAGTNLLHDQMTAISNNSANMMSHAITNNGTALLSSLRLTGPVVSGAAVGNSTDYIAATARGASQWGLDAFGGCTIGAYAVGASQRGWNASGPGGPWLIGPNAYGAAQFGFSDEMNAGYISATNLGPAAIQIFDFDLFDTHQHALTTASGGGSLMLGAGIASNKHALVVGSGAVSHGDGSITAAGGFYGDGSKLTGVSTPTNNPAFTGTITLNGFSISNLWRQVYCAASQSATATITAGGRLISSSATNGSILVSAADTANQWMTYQLIYGGNTVYVSNYVTWAAYGIGTDSSTVAAWTHPALPTAGTYTNKFFVVPPYTSSPLDFGKTYVLLKISGIKTNIVSNFDVFQILARPATASEINGYSIAQ